MIATKNISKGISLFIKTLIFIISICYIFQKLENIKHVIGFNELLQKTTSLYFIAALCLIAVNWGIEATKWKYLIRKLEQITFFTALKSVLSGVSISIFTPNRVGEFAGRVFYLKTEEKAKATIISFTGSFFQLLVTILAGIAAAAVYYTTHNNTLPFTGLINVNKLLIVLGISLVLIVILTKYLKNYVFKQIKEKITYYSLKELFNVFVLSLLRYLVFSFQYYLILLLFNIDIGLQNGFLLIAFTFFVSTVIPTFAFTEIAVRSATSVFFFTTVTNDTNAVVSASIMIWLINLALPALIGSAFIWKLNFFDE